MEHLNMVLSALVIVLAIAVVGLTSNLYMLQVSVTGLATEQSTISQAVIAKYVAISKSGNLSDGIDFGNITTLPATDVNATMNHNSTEQPMNWDNESLYWIELSSQSNVNADFCIRSTQFNTSGGAQIELGNYTWDDDTINNFTVPNYTARISLLTNESYTKGTSGVSPGNSNYYRFWLNVTDYVQPGIYNSTVWFEGVPSGDPCSGG